MIEDFILNKSGILTWSKSNIDQVPSKTGVFVLRESPINGFVNEINFSTNLRETLTKLYGEGLKTNFFSWYETKDEIGAQKLTEELKLKYQLENHEN